jgi:hypothetical protein
VLVVVAVLVVVVAVVAVVVVLDGSSRSSPERQSVKRGRVLKKVYIALYFAIPKS